MLRALNFFNAIESTTIFSKENTIHTINFTIKYFTKGRSNNDWKISTIK